MKKLYDFFKRHAKVVTIILAVFMVIILIDGCTNLFPEWFKWITKVIWLINVLIVGIILFGSPKKIDPGTTPKIDTTPYFGNKKEAEKLIKANLPLSVSNIKYQIRIISYIPYFIGGLFIFVIASFIYLFINGNDTLSLLSENLLNFIILFLVLLAIAYYARIVKNSFQEKLNIEVLRWMLINNMLMPDELRSILITIVSRKRFIMPSEEKYSLMAERYLQYMEGQEYGNFDLMN